MPASLSPLLPPPADGWPDERALAAVADPALALLHPLLDELRAGPLARSGLARSTRKPDGTVVTPVDLEVDERLVDALTTAFPAHGVVSEELDPVAGGQEWQWVIDPVDGTSNFAAGLPLWAVSIALCHGGVPVLGLVDAPDLDHRWVAVRGRGTTCDGRPVHVREVDRLDTAATAHLPLFCSLGLLARADRDAGVRLNPRVLGSTVLELTLVADGVGVVGAVTGGRVWDVAAGAVLVTEAGGGAAALERPVFPLVAGTDHTDLRTPAVVGPSHALVEEFVDRLTPAGGSLLA